ncbi:MAG: hypothetical protein U0J50_07985, partial [Peptacetobacter hiranonis]|nr:hypothetical protein [Peptacetobacter hiranonis]
NICKKRLWRRVRNKMRLELTDKQLERLEWLRNHTYVDLEADELKPNEDLTEEEMKLFKKYEKELEEESIAIECDRDGRY